MIADAVDAGWLRERVCRILEVDRRRVWRWQARAAAGTLQDRAPGGNPIHGLLAWEETAIIELFNQWGPVDLSPQARPPRLLHDQVWLSPSTVDGVLARHGLAVAG